jgi:hypothetical protein
MSEAVRVLATVGLGLLAGALLTEAAVLVPYWRSMSLDTFGVLHEGVAPRLYGYFAPLTLIAVLVAATSGAMAAASQPSVADDWLMIGSAVLAVSLLGFYRWYFERANRQLPQLAHDGDASGLAAELARWQLIHAVRTGVCLAAFTCAALAL